MIQKTKIDHSVKINELGAQLQQLNGEKDKLGNQIYVKNKFNIDV